MRWTLCCLTLVSCAVVWPLIWFDTLPPPPDNDSNSTTSIPTSYNTTALILTTPTSPPTLPPEPPAARLHRVKRTSDVRLLNNPCDPTHLNEGQRIHTLYMCYNTLKVESIVYLPLSSFWIGGYIATAWRHYHWYMTSTDHKPAWGDTFAYTGNDWNPANVMSNDRTRRWSKIITLTKAGDNLLISVNATRFPLTKQNASPQKPLCFHFSLFIYKSGSDPKFDISLCANMTESDDDDDDDDVGILTLGPQSRMSPKMRVVDSLTLSRDEYFEMVTGMSGNTNNWLLMAEQVGALVQSDCVVCLGPRPVLRVVPAPLSMTEFCITELMTKKNPHASCSEWEAPFPLTSRAIRPPVFNAEVPRQNFTCVTRDIPNAYCVGSLDPTYCVQQLDNSSDYYFNVARSDIW